ncbi:hypothetical protein ACSC9U_12620 [Pseudomonas solani]|uniref:hypothetical protein n=1 Tax=Pseudomonas solani TaxID=2731552 RepID=UPI003F4AE74D
MPQVHDSSAWWCLENGALGIGEDHTQPEGRQLAIDLIDSGLVTHLFIELADAHYGGVLANAQQIATNGGTRQQIQAACPDGNLFVCPISLKQVITAALKIGVPVHLADHPIMASRSSDFQRRHNSILQTFRTVTNQPGPGAAQAVGPASVGCLFLWGGAHFEGGRALDTFIPGLPFIMMG